MKAFMPTIRPYHPPVPSITDVPPTQWRTAALEVIDAIVGGAPTVPPNGEVTVRVPGDCWKALQELRGSPDEVSARAYAREHRETAKKGRQYRA